jgi:hypothetical protein
MCLNIIIAVCILFITTAIHAGGMLLVMQMFQRQKGNFTKRLIRVSFTSGVVILMFLASVLEVLVWALTYLALNAIQGFEKALYFSMVTFTTLGYGEIVFDEQYRLLSSFEAANGIIMFGWTTAIVIAIVQRIYLGDKRNG